MGVLFGYLGFDAVKPNLGRISGIGMNEFEFEIVLEFLD